MATSRPFRLLAGFTAGLLLALGGATASFADQLIIDGDGISPLNGGAASVVACTDKPVQFNVLIAALRQGSSSNQNFKNGTGVTVSFSSSTVLGVTASLADDLIQLPGNWENVDNSPPTAGTDTVTAVVTLPAQSAGGTGTVTFGFAGTRPDNTPRLGTTPVTVTWTTQACDSTPPALQLPAPITAEATGPSGAVVSYVASATDTVPLNPAVSCSPASGSTFPLGVTTVECSAADTAGNTATGSFTVTVQDTTAPTVGTMTNLQFEAGGPLTTATWVNPGATDAVDGNLSTTCVPASGDGFPVGETTVTCSAIDAHGNTGTASFTVKISDTTTPILVLPTDLTLEATGPGGAVATFTPTASDLVDGPLTVTCVPATGSTFPLGDTTVDCSATDTAGNSETGSFSVTVEDTTAPVVTVPAPITTEATGPNGASATFTASASDIVDGALAADCTPASGSVFALGTTTVTCTATDDAGNEGSSTFTVTVVDTTAPVVTVPAAITAEATGPSGAAVSYTATATDLVDGAVAPDCVPASGSTFALGSVQVDCTATDAAGNTSAPVSFAVTVVDSTGPAITVPGPTTAEAAGPDGAVVSYMVTATDLVDGAVTPTCAPLSGSTFALGETTVSCSATDTRGNEGSATFTVTVTDTTAPAVTVPANITEEATGPTGAPVTYTATATDLVDGAVTTNCTPASGSTFALDETTVTCTATDVAGNEGSATFTVTVVDTTAPVVTVPDPIVAEATGPTGAAASYTATATDLVDGTLAAACVPVSGSTFPLGTANVSCSATDAAGNTGSATFTVTVSDTTGPTVTVPSSFTTEATGPTGAAVTYSASATDLVDGVVSVTCLPVSGATFSLGYTDVICTATDAATNTGSAGFTVTVVDTTAPAITVPGPITAEATDASGATVTYAATAADLVNGSVTPSCSPASGSTFALGSTTVNCTATDAAGNTGSAAFSVTVVDTTAPAITVPGTITKEATGATGAIASYTATASDLVDGAVTPVCTPASGSTFALGDTTVSCSATDAAGNSSSATFLVKVVDTTKPDITWVDGPAENGHYVFGSVPAVGTCIADDLVSGIVPCTVTGYGTSVGSHTMTATASDTANPVNTQTETRTYTVDAWTLKGFYQPVDMNGVWNSVKGGSTVPLKFEIFAGATELTSTSAVDGFVVKGIQCPGSTAVTDDIELTTTGGTSLRYDATGGQFIQNWQTPKKAGACYEVTMTAQDGSKISANFKLK